MDYEQHLRSLEERYEAEQIKLREQYNLNKDRLVAAVNAQELERTGQPEQKRRRMEEKGVGLLYWYSLFRRCERTEYKTPREILKRTNNLTRIEEELKKYGSRKETAPIELDWLMADATREMSKGKEKEINQAVEEKMKENKKREREAEEVKMNPDQETRCGNCRCQDLLYVEAEAHLTCPECGWVKEKWQEWNEKSVPFDTPMKARTGMSSLYHELTRFREWLQHVQGTEARKIPQNLVEEVRGEYRKYRWRFSTANRKSVRGLLKLMQKNRTKKMRGLTKSAKTRAPDIKYSDWYSHSAKIAILIGGVTPPRLTHLETETMLAFFLRTLPAYEMCPIKITGKKKRSNFMGYSFVARKLAELLGYDQLAALFPRLSSSYKEAKEYMPIWQWICRYNKWQCIPDSADPVAVVKEK